MCIGLKQYTTPSSGRPASLQTSMLGSGAPPITSRYSSKESTLSYDSTTKSRSAAQTGAEPKQDTATSTFLLWDNQQSEMDDAMHMPDPKGAKEGSYNWDPFSIRGWLNALVLFVLLAALIVLFAGWPIIIEVRDRNKDKTLGAFNLGGINGTGQVPDMIPNFRTLIDQDTPEDVRTRTGFDGKDYQLVFSDEFETDGRTFHPGDDPFWEAVDLHYWPTGDFEWYDPSQAITKDGSLVLEMREMPTHGLDFRSGMLQSWNKMCFSKNAYIEVRVMLPGNTKIGGFWPGAWTMGNLGRPGYGATTEGTWPYSYDACDVGALPNQTRPDGSGPEAALTTGGGPGGALSFLPGQRWSACTCKGEDHPGPDVSRGRGSPEIDIIEAQINLEQQMGDVSQSLQVAPFDDYYQWNNRSDLWEHHYPDEMMFNTYLGGTFQQAVSTLVQTKRQNYREQGGGFGVYGFEYTGMTEDRENGYITWVSSGKPSWTVRAGAVGPNPRSEVDQRLIPEEPMAMILNFGMSNNFQAVNFQGLEFVSRTLESLFVTHL